MAGKSSADKTSLDSLKKDVIRVLSKHNGSIPVDSFWNIFPNETGYTPPKAVKRQVLQNFSDVIEESRDKDGKRVFKLKTLPAPTTLPVLKTQILAVLNKCGGKVVHTSFWTTFKNRHGYLPEPKDFGLDAFAKRSELLQLPDVKTSIEEVSESGTRYLQVRSVRPKTVQPKTVQPKTIQPKTVQKAFEGDSEKWPSLQESKSVKTKPEVVVHTPAETVPVNGTAEDMADRRGRSIYNPQPGPYSRPGRAQSPYVAQPYQPRQQQQPSGYYYPVAAANAGYNGHHGHNRHQSPAPRAGQSHPRQARFNVAKEQLDSVAEDCIERLAESKEYVSSERIEKLLLQHYGANSLQEINNLRSLEQISVVNDHIRMQCKVNAYIQAFIKVRSIATAHELGLAMKEFAPKGQDFEALHLGPLIKQPLVYQFFKLPEDGDILELDSLEVLQHLREYLTKNDSWTSKQNKLEDFMQYLMDEHGITNPYELGIRIRSLPLACQVLKKAQRDAGQSIRSYQAHLKDNVESDLTVAFNNFTQAILHKAPGVCEMRQVYLQMNPVAVVHEVFNKWTTLYQTVTDQQWLEGNRAVRNSINKTKKHVSKFQALLLREDLAASLFKFVIVTSKEDAYQQLQEVLGLKEALEHQQQQQQQQQLGRQPGSDKPKPALQNVVTGTIKYLERCLLHGSLALSHLSKIEEKLLSDFEFPNFQMMTQTRFLEFILENEDIKKFLDDCGGGLMGLTSGGATAESAFHPSYSDLLEFVKQCGSADQAKFPLLESALCGHYGVHEVKALGHGSLPHLVSALEKQHHQQHHQQHHRSSGASVWYEGALCAKQRSVCMTGERKVGIAGHQSKEKALACLQNCPLLEDLAEWSAWDLVFRPELGDLKDFIQKYGGIYRSHLTENNQKYSMTTQIMALETKPGVLLKITSDTSTEKFATAALAGDITATCGHLVSLIVTNKGLENTPLALMSNHVKTALYKLQAKKNPRDSVSSGPDGAAIVSRFVLECLVKLPLVICQGVANTVFLDPLGSVVGSTKSKDLILQSCRDQRDSGRVQLLGFLLGIGSWSRGFQDRLVAPKDCLEKQEVLDLGTGETIELLSDSESEPEEESNDEDDSDFFLSDEEDVGASQMYKAVDNRVEVLVESEQDATEDSSIMEVSDSDICEVKMVDGKPSDQVSDDDSVQLLDSEDGEEKDEVKEEKDDAEPKEENDNEQNSQEVSGEEEEEEEEEEEQNPCKVIVDQIRSEEFGVDVVLSEDGQKLMQKQQERLGRSLDRLSKDLYSKDTHFVLELVQNADDNSYPEQREDGATVTPAVKFLVDKDCITVLNNERGFQEANIRAVCDVGRSTKGKHKFGYIGQKGIGFKSVFRVTDRPEIHSNGYHLCFDVNSGPTGYILPHWLDQDSGKEQFEKWTTRIVLPLKDEMKVAMETQPLAARFHDVHPSLLLFLHRLRHLAVINKVENYTTKMQRRDVGNGLIEIRHMDGTDKWLVVRKMLDASMISIQAKSGVEVESTEIALAFPILSPEMMAAHALPDKQPVFAYLPLRSYGFRFVIQGDFDVPSSREDVDKDSMWNQWLRNEIHMLFVEALETFKNHPDFAQIEAVCMYLQFIPLEDEILDFFRPVASNILQQLKARPCLPTQPTAGSGIQWKMPSQLVYTRDSLLSEVVTSQMLRSHLSLDYLHPEVAAQLNPSLMQSLGIQSLSTQHLLEIGKVLVRDMASLDGPALENEAVKVSKWLACIFRSLDEFGQNGEVMTLLKSLPMILLVDGSLTSLGERGVFFPLDAEERQKKQTRPRDPLWQLERDLNTIHPALISCLDKVANSQACHLLEKLGVKRLSPPDIIHHHIMPVLKSEAWKQKDRQILLAYLIYIKQQLDHDTSLVSIDDLKQSAVLLTNNGLKVPGKEAIHFTPAYGSRIDLQKLFPGYNWVLLDAAYLQGNMSRPEIQSWFQFFSRLGVLEFLSVEPVEEKFTAEQLESSPWSDYKDLLPQCDSYVITDWQCQEFVDLVTENTEPESHAQQMGLLYQALDKQWDSQYAKYCHTKIKDSKGNTLKDAETSFSMLLKGLEWLPAVVTEAIPEDESVSLHPVPTLLAGEQLFLRSPPLERILAHHVPYLIPSTSANSSFSDFLKIQKLVKLDFLQDLLRHFGRRTPEEPDKPQSFCASVAHMKAVYNHLSENMPPRQLFEFAEESPIIFLVAGKMGKPEDVVKGLLLKTDEVQWADPSGLFAKYRESLQGVSSALAFKPSLVDTYGSFNDFFVRSLRVQQAPSLLELAKLLIHIASSLAQPKALVDVLYILSIIGGEVSNQPNDAGLQALTQLLKDKPVLPARGAKWAAAVDNPMLADNRQLEDHFKNKEGVFFLDLGEKLGVGKKRTRKNEGVQHIQLEQVKAFLNLLGVKPLSECINIEYISESYRPCPSLQSYVHSVIPYIQLSLCTNFDEIYQAWLDEDVTTTLSALQFGQVGRLDLVHSLKHKPDTVETLTEKCRMIKDREFLVHFGSVESYLDINKELARHFSRGDDPCYRELKNFLMELLPLVQSASPVEMKKFLAEQRFGELPEGEEAWEVPAPVVYIPPPPPPTPEPEQQAPTPERAATPQQGDGGGGGEGGLKAWPPRSYSAGMADGTRPKSSGSQMWPPPAPPQYQDRSSLPANLRPPRLQGQSTEGAQSGEGESRGERDPQGSYAQTGESRQRVLQGERPSGEERPHGEARGNAVYAEAPSTGAPTTGARISEEIAPQEPTEQQQEQGEPSSTGEENATKPAEEEEEGEGENSEVEDMEVTPAALTRQTSHGHQVDTDDIILLDDAPDGDNSANNGADNRAMVVQKAKRLRVDSGPGNNRSKGPFFFYSDPVWTQDCIDSFYEDIDRSLLGDLPTEFPNEDFPGQDEVGLWGERLVKSYLEKRQLEDPNIVEVIWVDEMQQQGKPYDFVVKVRDPSDPYGEVKDYFIEVKSTGSSRKAFFEISLQEVKFAEEQKARYHLYRVLNAGRHESVKLSRLENLSQKLHTKQIKLCMIV